MGKAVTTVNTPNQSGYFLPADENRELKKYPFLASSSALSDGAAVGREISSNTTTGNLKVMGTENAAGFDFVGILAEPIATTDADYATAGKLKGVRVPKNALARAFFAVGAGTFSAVDVGKTVEITSGGLGLSVDIAGKGARIVEYISATKGICTFSMPTTETA